MIPIGSPWDPFIELEDCIVFQVQDFSSPDQCVAEGCSGQTLRHPQLFAHVYMRSAFPVHIMFVSQVCVRSLFLSCAFAPQMTSGFDFDETKTCFVVVCLLLIVHSPMLFCIFSLIIILQLLPAAVCIQIATSVIAAGVMAKLVVVVKIARLATSGQAAVLKLLKIAMLAAVLAKIAVVLLANAAGVRDKHTKRSSPFT